MADEPKRTWEVVFYEAANGARPAEEWYRDTPTKAQARFAWIFELLEEHGTNVGRPHVAPIQGKIWEVRVEHERVQYWLLYFAASERKFVMVHGLTKGQKITTKDIALARQRMEDYVARLQAGKERGGRGELLVNTWAIVEGT